MSTKSSKKAVKEIQQHAPLQRDYETDALGDGKLKTGSVTRKRRRRDGDEDYLSDEADEKFVDAALSRKILQIAREQQDEEEQEGKAGRKGRDISKRFQFREDFPEDQDNQDDQYEDIEDDDEDDEADYADLETFQLEELADIGAEADGEAALFQKFLPPSSGGGGGLFGFNQPVTLADKIMEKLAEKEFYDKQAKLEKPERPEFPPKVIEVYEKVGLLLSRYRSGKLPRAFKIIPGLKNWEDILFLTDPSSWSPNACYEATKLLVSSLQSKQSQLFMSDILLDRVRDDIRENKALNYHLYRSLKKSLYKPAAFFKGFLFPLCESGSCTLREAVIVGSVLSKISIPALHSSAALLRLAEMDTYSGANSLFMRVLIDKKYALPYKVIDGVVLHFLQYRNHLRSSGGGELPILWHRAFLAFAQRYKNDITDEQREALLDVVRACGHVKIGPEVRRELREGVERGTTIAGPDDL
ncbi:Bystin-domain-containing protein [Lipomyces oligophaga]|uniref:Bystin-domain-containing protein n=1 Tax=Lipomyces oligophaga TaxID=45792 RepID=UPI0034CDEEBF